jgi:hypothetical protein
MAFEDSLKSISLNADSSIAGFTGVSGIAAGGGPSTFVKIASIAFSTPNVTVTTAAAHGYSVGDVVYIANATTAGNNGGFTVASIGSATTFTFANTSGAVQAAAAGTVNKTNFNQLYRFVKITGAKTAGLVTSSNDYSIGVLQNKPQYTGQAAQVGFLGVSYVITGSGVAATNIAAGDKIAPDTLGAAIKFQGGFNNALNYTQGATTSSVSGSTVTMTLGAAGSGTTADLASHGALVGDIVNISGATTATNNGTFVITAVGATTISFINAAGTAQVGAASSATKIQIVRSQIVAGTALASSSTPGELIPVLLAAR